jgi:hypothetical protein
MNIRQYINTLFSKTKYGVKAEHYYEVECYDKDGNLKWAEKFPNIVVTAGLNKYLDATLKTGLASPAWYVGLKSTGTPDPTDTMTSHGTWTEVTDTFSAATRPAWTPGSISSGSVSNTASKASYAIDAGGDIYGAFLCDSASGTSGTLLGVGNFTAPRAVISGDTLNVTVTCTQTAA